MFKRFGKSFLALFCAVVLLVSMVGTSLFTTAAATTIVQDFEAPTIWDGDGSSIKKDETIFINENEGYQQYIASEEGDTNVHSGSKSLYRPNFSDATRNCSLITEGMELVVGQKYNVSMWIKVLEGNGNLKFTQLTARSNGSSGSWNDPDTIKVIQYFGTTYEYRNQWKEFTFSFTAAQKYFGISSESVGFYLDDVVITPATAEDVTVKVNANNGEEVPDLVGAPGAALTLPTVARGGYTLEGWYTDSGLTAPFTSNVFPNADTEIFAKWEIAGYTQDFENADNLSADYSVITTDVHGGEKAISGVKRTNLLNKNLELIPGQKYSFELWAKVIGNTAASPVSLVLNTCKAMNNPWGTSNTDYTITWIQAGETTRWQRYTGEFVATYKCPVLVSSSGSLTVCWDDITITPVISTQVTITVNANNGEDVPPLVGEPGTSLIMPTVEKTGYILEGWYTNSGLTESFASAVYPDADTEIYAKWIEAPEVTITVNANNGESINPVKGYAGTALTMPTVTKPGYYLVGWYTDSALSVPFDDSKYPSTDTTVWAKWLKNGTLYQDFENYQSTSALSSAEIYDKTASADGHVLGGNRSLKGVSGNVRAVLSPSADAKLTPGKSYKITANIYVPSTTNAGQIEFSLLSDFNNAWSYVNENNKGGILTPYLNPSHEPSKATMDKWNTYTNYFYIPEGSKYVYFGLSSWGASGYYVDNVTIEEVPTVTVTVNTNGGSEIAPVIGAAGQTLIVDNPTPPEGKEFAGWCSDPELKNAYKITVFPNENITIYARYITAGCYEQDFEQWNYEPNTDSQSEPFTLYTAKSQNDPNVYSGKHSMYFDGGKPEKTGKTWALTIFDNTMKPLVIGEKYKATFRFKLDKTEADKNSVNQRTYHCLYYTKQAANAWSWQTQGCMGGYAAPAFYNDELEDNHWYGTSGAVSTTTKKDANGWFTMTYEFTASTPYIALYMTNIFEYSMWIDAITIDPLPTGYVSKSDDTTYCEEFYNVLAKNSAATALNIKDKTVQKLELDVRGDYIFAASLKKGSLGNSRVYLAWDSEGKNMIEGTEFIGNTDTFKRNSARIITDLTGIVYLVTEGGGADSYEKVQLFLRKFAKADDPNPYYVRPAVDYNKLPTKSAAAEVSFSDDSPITGDDVFAPIALIIVTFAAASVVLMRKRGAFNE